MKVIETADQRTLVADEGVFLTNGDTAGDTVVLPVDADYSVWHEITEAEYENMEKEVENNG